MPTLMQLTEWLEARGALRLTKSNDLPLLPRTPRSNGGRPQVGPSEGESVHLVDWDRLMGDSDSKEGWWEFHELFDYELRMEIEQIACGDQDPPPIELKHPISPDGKTAHWDYCAWYQSVHFFGAEAGIYIRDECVQMYARRLGIRYRHMNPNPIPTQLFRSHLEALTRGAALVLFLHEQYHHSIESLGFRLHAVLRSSAYLDYIDKVYRPLFGTDDCLEEALANANMWHRIGDNPYRKKLSRAYVEAIRAQLADEFPFDPPGYNKASEYLPSLGSFDKGHDRLLCQVLAGDHRPTQPISDWMPATHMSHPIFRVTSNFWTVIPSGGRSILPLSSVHISPKKTTSTDGLISALKILGYIEVKGAGKGSHKKLAKSGWPTLILPGDRENLSPGVARCVMHEFGLTLKEFQDFLRNPAMVITPRNWV